MSKREGRDRRNRRAAFEGPPMYLRVKPEILIAYREIVEKGYEGSLSEWINEHILAYLELIGK